jgi:hypothetical protein
LIKGTEYDDDARHGAEAHGEGEAEFLSGSKEQVSDDKPRHQGQQEIDDAAIN